MLTFQTDIVIRGKKAEKYQELANKYEFLLVDIYMMSGVLGFINNQKDVQDNESSITANIPRNVLQSRADKIDFLYQVVALSEEIDIDAENAMKLAFEENSIENPKKLYKRELFDDYAMGGIDILYDMLSDDYVQDILKYIPASEFWALIEDAKDAGDTAEQFVDRIRDYIEFGNDVVMRTKLIVIWEKYVKEE